MKYVHFWSFKMKSVVFNMKRNLETHFSFCDFGSTYILVIFPFRIVL